MIPKRFRTELAKLTVLFVALAALAYKSGADNPQTLLLFTATCATSIFIGKYGSLLYLNDRRYRRQLIELEMEAHKLDVTAVMISEFPIWNTNEVAQKELAKGVNRSQKCKVLLDQFGFVDANKMLKLYGTKQLAEKNAAKAPSPQQTA